MRDLLEAFSSSSIASSDLPGLPIRELNRLAIMDTDRLSSYMVQMLAQHPSDTFIAYP
jgi:hypothetical protein